MIPKAPQKHIDFRERYPRLAAAWDQIGEAGRLGPLDEKTQRLIKLGIALGAQHEGSTHSSVRKALAMGISREEIEQVVTLTAGTLGLPFVVAADTWVQDVLEEGVEEE
jgi:4-carboxymuconolactone decarboxylase